jgi:hypothetical protein
LFYTAEMRKFLARTLRPFVRLWGFVLVLLPYLAKLIFDDALLAQMKAHATKYGVADKAVQVLDWMIQRPVRSAAMIMCAIFSWSAVAASRQVARLSQPALSPNNRARTAQISTAAGNRPSLTFLGLEVNRFPEYGNATAFLLPVRNDAMSSKGDASNVIAYLTYQRLLSPVAPPLEVHRGLWQERNSWDLYIGAGETLHLVLVVVDGRGCGAPNLPSVQPQESVSEETLGMIGRPQPQTISVCGLDDGNWRVAVTLRGENFMREGFKSRCTVLLTIEQQLVKTYKVVSEERASGWVA